MGMKGAGMAIAMSNALIFIAMNVYMLFIDEIQEAVKWPDKRMFKDIWPYLKLGVPSSLSICFDWWAFELMTLFSGILGVKEQAC